MSDFLDDLCRKLEPFQDKRIPATLILDGHPVSSGLAALESHQGCFWPKDGNNLDKFPLRRGTLKLSQTGEQLKLTDFRRCPTGKEHYHFRIGSYS